MKNADRNPTFEGIPTTWSALIGLNPLRPMHDKADLDNATEIIDAMAGHKLNRDQDDYLDALSTLVSAYEEEHYPVDISHVSGLDALKSLLADHEMGTADLCRLLGVHRSHASKILNGERSLTVKHLRKLSEHFKVEPRLFM